MAPPKSGSTKAKAPAAAPSAAKKENKPPAAAAAAAPKPSTKAQAPAPPTAAKKAAPEGKKKAPAPPAAAAPPKPVAEKKPAEAKPAAAAAAKKVKTEKPKPKKTPAAPKKTTTLKGKATSGGGKKKKITNRFVIDCTLPAEDQLFNCADFEKFLRERIKVSGKTSNFGGNLNIERGEKNKLAVNASIPFSKRYLKYLTKKYLKKNLLRDTLRVIATSKDGYELRYFQIGNEADDDEEDAE